jgi:2-keto-4-pentenoate hydratase/2-oxohepta-3-ene-1,7-dioic acid hydratase in catechol pathway
VSPGPPTAVLWRRQGFRLDSLSVVRIARFTKDGDLSFGVVEDDDTIATVAAHPFGEIQFTGERQPLADVRLTAPILPNKVIAIGRNYAEHAKELGNEVPAEPLIFMKPSTSVIGQQEAIVYPPLSERVDFEGELAVVIGRLCREVPAERAREVILGYTCANDVTARDLQKKDGQWSRAKGFDSFCPLGPWIETDLDPQHFADGVRIQTHLNGDLVQDGSTRDLIFDIPTLIAHITAAMTLLPGDVILTGTPEGVGPMQVGDEVEVSIAGLGALTNTVVKR